MAFCKAAVSLLVFAIAVVACGSQPSTSQLHGKRQSTHGGRRGQNSLPPHQDFLGINPMMSFQADSPDAKAIALAKPVSSGTGFKEIISGTPYATLLKHYRGAAIGDLHVDFELTDSSPAPITITNIQVQVVAASRQPLSGTLLPIAHAGTLAATQYLVNMDSPDRVLRRSTGPYSRKLAAGKESFPDASIHLTPGEQNTVGIDFLASSGYFACQLKFTYQIGTTVYTETVGAPPKLPFAVTGKAHRYSAVYASSTYTGLTLKP